MPKSDGYKNLKVPTSEQARKNGAKGGKKSAKVQAQKRALKETIEMFLTMTPTSDLIDSCVERFGFNPKDFQEIVTGGLFMKAINGDPKAFEVLRDTIGQKPVNVNEITGANGEQLIKTVYVTKEEKNKVNEHINSVIDN